MYLIIKEFTVRLISILSVLLLSQAAVALPVYQCDLKAFSKSKGLVLKRQALLSPSFSTDVQFPETSLKLFVDVQGNISGFVNNQYNFILNGDVESAKFESATDSGTIRCEAVEEASYVLYNKTSGAYISKELIQTADQSVFIQDVVSDNLCFLGDAQSAAQALKIDTKAKVLSVKYLAIELEVLETKCLESNGDREDYKCLQESQELVQKVIRECNETSDPRI